MRIRLLAVSTATLALAGCATASRGEPAAPVTSELADPGAATPAAAAIGYDRSIHGKGGPDFACLPDGEYTSSVVISKAEPRASATRTGSTWVVDISHLPSEGTDSRYRVSHRTNGYCVSGVLPIPVPTPAAPSTPGRGPSTFQPTSPAPTTPSR